MLHFLMELLGQKQGIPFECACNPRKNKATPPLVNTERRVDIVAAAIESHYAARKHDRMYYWKCHCLS